MKKFLKLIPAICMLMIATILVSTATYAWFSMNNSVTATGMTVKAQASGALVISDEFALNLGSAVNVNLSSDAKVLVPATHFFGDTYVADSDGGTSSSCPSKLLVLQNTNVISTTTGLAASKDDTNPQLYYQPGVVNTNYIDYVVYIATAGAELTSQDLTVAFDGTTTSLSTLKAASIDFYVNSYSGPYSVPSIQALGEFKGTLNVAGFDNQTNNLTAKTSLKLVDNGTIPLNIQNSADDTVKYLQVTMRVYFDGQLKKQLYSVTANAPATFAEGTQYYTVGSSTDEGAIQGTGTDTNWYVPADIDSSTFVSGTHYTLTIQDATAFVNSAEIATSAIELGVKFSATNHA